MHKAPIYLILAVIFLCVVPGSAYAGSLVAHWAFDGDGSDTSGNRNDATPHGNVAYAPGIYGQAAQFHGSGDYFQVANNPGIQLRSGQEYSVAAYVKASTLGQQSILIHGLGCSTWASWFLGVQGGEPDAPLYADRFVFGVRTSSGSSYTAATAPAVAGEWVHVAASYDGTALTLYTNGEARGSVAAPLPFDSQENLCIGGDPGCSGRSWYTGLVDDVCIFNRAMTTNQVREAANGTLPTWFKAGKPEPADGTVGVGVPLFRWNPGDGAVLHNAYLGASPDLTAADQQLNRSPMALFYYTRGLQPGATYYWRVDEIDKDGVTVHTGDVWSFVAQALTAFYPDPADGANTVSPNPTLTWKTGTGAIKHHLYFGNDRDAVTQGTAAVDKGTLAVTETTFQPGALETLTSYFWRVDEVLMGDTVRAGSVWQFTTCLPVDDFDSYTDEAGQEIFSTWLDGFATGLNGSTVGYGQAPFAESVVTHGGTQSMPLDYNNVVAPFYSETEREFSTPQDWTANGIDTLVLYVRGSMSNAATPLYVALEDTAKHRGTVVHPDPAVVKALLWVEWRIPLNSFAGVNLAKIKKIYIGLGDRNAPAKGGTGLIFIDDIIVTKP